MKPIYIDIETLPTDDSDVIDRLAATVRCPGNITKPESIDKWMQENAEMKHKELIAKTALDGAYGRIACIGWMMDGDAHAKVTQSGLTERQVIENFYEDIEDIAYISDSVCGHNIFNFDLPFLRHRSIILGIKPPPFMRDVFESKIWDEKILDTMYIWTQDRNKYISLDTLCWLFGIDGKNGFDGSMVADTWATDPQKVIEYCEADVIRHRDVYKRLTFGSAVF